MGEVGSVRTILWLDEGEQIPVITNLERSVKPARVVHCLRLRWRQENSFKYLKENYAIDQIIQYGADEESEDRLAPNPKRAALQQRVRELREQIQALEAELGRAVEGNDERRRRTVRGMKIAHGKLRRHLAGQRQMLGRLENRLRHTPSQLPQSELGRGRRALPQEDRRIVLNTLKLVAYNAERMLAFKFNEHYRQSKDVLSVFRGLLNLPGTAHRLSADRIEVRLQRPQPEKVAAALQSFLENLNRQQPRLLGDGPILEFALGS